MMAPNETRTRVRAEADERAWREDLVAETRDTVEVPTVDPTHDPGVVLGGPLPEGATRTGRP